MGIAAGRGGLGEALMPSCPCFGACRGQPLWRDPETGLYCTVCHGTGQAESHDQRKLDAEWWEEHKRKERERAAKREAENRMDIR